MATPAKLPPTKSVSKVLGISGMLYLVLSAAGVTGKLVELAMKDPPKQLGPALTVIPILMIIIGGISINGMLSGNELKAVVALAMGFVSVFFFDKIIEYTERRRKAKALADAEDGEIEAEAAADAAMDVANDIIAQGADDMDDDEVAGDEMDDDYE